MRIVVVIINIAQIGMVYQGIWAGAHIFPHTFYYTTTKSIDFCCFLSFSLACAKQKHNKKNDNNKNTTNVALQYNFPYDFLGAFSHKPFRRFIHSAFFFFFFCSRGFWGKKFSTLILASVWEGSSLNKKRTESDPPINEQFCALLPSFCFTFHLDISCLWMCVC